MARGKTDNSATWAENLPRKKTIPTTDVGENRGIGGLSERLYATWEREYEIPSGSAEVANFDLGRWRVSEKVRGGFETTISGLAIDSEGGPPPYRESVKSLQ